MATFLQIGEFIDPAPVSFTFDAPGWYVLTALFVLCIIATTIAIAVHYRKNRYRKNALKQINEKLQYFSDQKNYNEILYMTNSLIKKIMIQQHGRLSVASLQGQEWLDFLNKQCQKAIFEKTDADLLTQLYSTDNHQTGEKETMVFVTKAKQWIKKHRYASVYL